VTATDARNRNRLDRPVGPDDHALGSETAPITLVEYGSYACPHCRAANERIAEARDKIGERLRYVFRHCPVRDDGLARRAAVLVEHAKDADRFWEAHIALMSRSEMLTEDDITAVAQDLGVPLADIDGTGDSAREAQARVTADETSARASGVMFTPTFFINSRRYDGPWDESSFSDAMLGTLGHRFRSAALDFASWGPSAGVLLLLATLVAVIITNTGVGPGFERFWEQYAGLSLGAFDFKMSLRHWVNDGLLTIFFLVVGLEIKREFTVGHLASRRSAALPIAAAIGGMAVPALIYVLVIPPGDWAHGWGIPMATDTAFAVALIVMMGSRVPVELRIFLTAAAIVDDIGAIAVVAVFYSHDLHFEYLFAAAAIIAALAALNRSHVYLVQPYVLMGIALWACVLASGLHATLAGVILALFIPTRPPATVDVIIDCAAGTEINELLLAGGVAPSDVGTFRAGDGDLLLTLPGGGSVTVRGFFLAPGAGIDRIVFDHAPPWTRDELAARAVELPPDEAHPAGADTASWPSIMLEAPTATGFDPHRGWSFEMFAGGLF